VPGSAKNESAGQTRARMNHAEPGARPERRRYFFIHLMKTAGTSFAFQLQQQFQPHEVYPARGFDRRDDTDIAGYVSISRLLRLSPDRRAEILIYTGHFPFVASQLLNEDLATLTMLRDPVERTISVLKHFKRRSRRYHAYPLERIYDDPFVFAHFVENHQTRMFSVTPEDEPEAFGSTMSYWATAAMLGLGNPNYDPETQDAVDRERAIAAAKASAVDEPRFELAKQQLAKVDVIGFSEQYDAFIEDLRRRFGWWPSGLDTRAKANISAEKWEEPKSLRARIVADNPFDIELYEYAKELVRSRQPRSTAPTAMTRAGATPRVSKASPAEGPAPAERPLRRDQLRAEIRAKHPRFFEAVVADARITAAYRNERTEYRSRLDALLQAVRLMCVSDAFLGQALYRAKARLQALGIPMLPWIAHRLAMMTAQICIGDPVVLRPGIYIAHGQVVIDGFVEVHRGTVIFPWVTIGLRAGDVRGPTIGQDVHIGTGAKIIGPITVHRSARIGANAVVVDNVPARTTVAGVPARPVRGTTAT